MADVKDPDICRNVRPGTAGFHGARTVSNDELDNCAGLYCGKRTPRSPSAMQLEDADAQQLRQRASGKATIGRRIGTRCSSRRETPGFSRELRAHRHRAPTANLIEPSTSTRFDGDVIETEFGSESLARIRHQCAFFSSWAIISVFSPT